MKKLFFILFLICNGLTVLAQDTVRYQDPWYKFNPMPPLQTSTYDTYGCNSTVWDTDLINGLRGAHLVSYTGPLGVLYGIAITTFGYPIIDSFYSAVYLRDLEYTRDTIPSWEEQIWVSHYTIDTINWARSPLKKHCMFEYEFSIPSPSTRVVDCYEFYFDEPIINDKTKDGTNSVNDTFFVGKYLDFSDWPTEIWPDRIEHFMMGFDPTVGQFSLIGNCFQSGLWVYPDANSNDYCGLRQVWGLAFPIIGLRCTAPRGLRVNRVDSLYTAVWNEDEDAELFQLSMCSGGQMPEDGNIVTVSGHSYDLGGWVPDSTHHLYLRKQCDYSTPSHSRQVWSDWSRMPDPEPEPEEADTNGINAVATLAMELVPNPAQERVTVRCVQAEGGTVSVVDMQGRTLLTQAAKATTVLDISTLPDGPYLVRIVTPTATATRKLSVVR